MGETSMKKLALGIAFSLACVLPAHAEGPAELLVALNSSDLQTQGFAFVLAGQALEQKAHVRVLLCSAAGQLAVTAKESAALKPKNISPKQMLQGLMKKGAQVEVCALFLPNSDLKPADLMEGVTVAKPPEIAAHILKPTVRMLTF
jgi:intracellular sulfur oxidation DsrE/DsrF family protein